MNKPELFAYTRRAKYDPSQTNEMLKNAGQQSLGGSTSHWKSNSQMTNE